MKRANYLQIFRWCGLVIFLLMIAAPIYWLFITAFKPEIDIFANPPQYLPGNITFEHFIDVWFGTSFPVFFRNSLLVAGTAGSITTIAATLAGYALAKFQFRLKSTVLFLLIATQMFPILLLVVPLFTQLAAWKLVNSLTGLILVYAAFNIPFCVLLMRGFFVDLPKELDESAQIDGCGQFGAFWRIMLPLSLPGLAATLIFAFISAWNELLFAVMLINSDSKKPLTIGLASFIEKYNISWGLMCAGAVIALIPIFVLFAYILRYLTAGLVAGAVKG